MNGSLGCGCHHKSEHMVRVFLKKEFGEDEIIDGGVDWCKNHETNRWLPFDKIIWKLRIICEVDVEQHYQEHSFFKGTLDERKARDKYKEEKAIENGFSGNGGYREVWAIDDAEQ